MFESLFGVFRKPHHKKPMRPLRFTPSLELLEGRLAPAVLIVNSAADNHTADAALTLREAIQVVDGTLGRSLTAGEKTQVTGTLGNNDTIQFNLPAGMQTITLTGGVLSITKAVTLNGPGTDSLTVNANNTGRAFLVGHDYAKNLNLVASISGLTVTGGSALGSTTNFGGGLLNFGTLTLSNCVFNSNTAGSSGGGAVYNAGALTILNCTFSNNTVTNTGDGAGIQNASAALLNISASTFSANAAINDSSGGGIANSGTATVTGSTFTGNSAASNGAGIHNSSSGKLTLTNCTLMGGVSTSDGGGFDSDGAVTVNDCTFANNSVGSEGGAIDSHGTLSISNSTLAGNSAASRGGAINLSGTSQIVSCTFTGNIVTASNGGGAIYGTTSARIYNTIVAGNLQGSAPNMTPSDIVGTVASSCSYDLIGMGGSGGITQGVFGNQVGVANPRLGTLGNNGGPTQTCALLPGSPALDRGGNVYVPAGTTDQRGLTRIINNRVDIGAYEVQVPYGAIPSSFTMAGSSSIQAGQAGTFTVTVLNSSGKTFTGYVGTIHFTSSDQQATLPADYTFLTSDKGVHTFSVTLKTAGPQSLTVTDPYAGAVGTKSIVVSPAGASTLTVAGISSPTQAGESASVTVTAMDAFGNLATGYSGTVHFTSSDNQATLPSDYTFTSGDQGVHAFNVTFQTSGTQSVRAMDTVAASVAGSQTGISVSPPPVLLVNTVADNTVADNFLTLREALAVVNGTLGRALTIGEQSQVSGALGVGDIIRFTLPSGSQTITLAGGPLMILKPVTIDASGAGGLVIDGNHLDRVFIVGNDYSQDLSLQVGIAGLTIANGSAVAAGKNYGGGLLNFGTLTLSNVAFSGNTAGSSGGGAIYNDGALTVRNSVFTANSVGSGGSGGGVQNAAPATITVLGCTFTGNTTTGGGSGAAIANSGQASVSESTISGNSADSNAGGISNSSDGTLTVTACTIANNTCGSDGAGIDNDGIATVTGTSLSGNSAASEGGGVGNKGTLLGMTNCTLYGNSAVSDGGGLATSGPATLTNCTITANRVTTGSGGVFGGGIFNVSVAAKLYNTIVAGNFQGAPPSTIPDDVAGSIDLGSAFNLIGTGGSGGLTNGVNNNQVGVANPGLGALAANGGGTMTVALLAGSPAVDQGGNSYVASIVTDQRGFTRIVGGTVDIGAFEVQ